jgi:hypothetical protein
MDALQLEGASPVLRRDPTDAGRVRLENMDLAAFLRLRGLDLVHAEKTSRYRYRFVFDDPEGQADELALEFVNSEISRYCAAVVTLKSVIANFSSRRPEDSHARSQPRGNGRSR